MTAIATSRVLLMAAGCIGIALPTFAAAPQPARVAIAGMIDIDSDGESDLEIVRRVIAVNGGVIDAEIHIDGNSKGQLQRATAYVIVGKLPGEVSVSPKAAQQFDAFMRRATQLHIPVVHVNDLLTTGSRRPITEFETRSLFRRHRWPPRQGAY